MRLALALLLVSSFYLPAAPAPIARQVVLIVWDGMRPDFVSETNTPTLCSLARRGVTFAQHHSVYPSATEVNGTAIATGAYPSQNGIVGNHEYRPDIDKLKDIRTEGLEAVRKADQLTKGRHIRLPTIAEQVRRAGGRTVVAGAKPVALLADRSARTSPTAGATVFAGAAIPASLTEVLKPRYGAFPAEDATNRTRIDWTTDVLLNPLWTEGVPEFSLLWLNEPDSSQHRTGPGSPESLAGMRNADQNLARVLRVLEANGVLERTDVIVTSDHGCSTVKTTVDVAKSLADAGIRAVREFKAPPEKGEVLVVSNSGSTFIYVIGHDEGITQKIVEILQGWEFSGVIFTRKPHAGTFSLREVHLDSEEAPDVVVSLRWSAERNKNGVAGMIPSDRSSFGVGQGLHVTLSPYDMHATMIAAGPSFRSGVVSTLASGNVDIAPTILWLLGIKPAKPMNGRVLTEALTLKGPRIESFEPGHIEATRDGERSAWQQYLNYTEVNGVRYIDEGNGRQVAK